MPTVEGAESAAAFWLDYNLLYLERPFCHHVHYHCADRSPYNDIREGNCLQKHLPKRLRGQPLYYRLLRGRSPCEPRGEDIRFPKAHARGSIQGNFSL